MSQSDLKAGEKGLGKSIEGASFRMCLIEVELATKELHPQQSEDNEEEEKQQQQRCNGLHRV